MLRPNPRTRARLRRRTRLKVTRRNQVNRTRIKMGMNCQVQTHRVKLTGDPVWAKVPEKVRRLARASLQKRRAKKT